MRALRLSNDKSLKRLAKQMAHVMYKNAGCGLAAPQVGVLKRLVVIDCDRGGRRPRAHRHAQPRDRRAARASRSAEDEGCLSIPGISVPIARPPFARCRYYDLDGRLWEIEGDGLLGRCLQHETDHLDGVTMFERAEPMARSKALEDYELRPGRRRAPRRDFGGGVRDMRIVFMGTPDFAASVLLQTCLAARSGCRLHAPRRRARPRQAAGAQPR